MENRFYAVTAKCGHVGRHQYYEGTFYERANDAKEAAAIVRNRPRVKHDHKDAILWVEEISYDEFKAGQESFKKNPYHRCESKWQQRIVWDRIEPFIRPETNLQNEHRQSNRLIGKYRNQTATPKLKKPYKRERSYIAFDCECRYAV